MIDGKWEMPIVAFLFFGKKRYGELEKEILKINSRMLSKQLRDLETNGIVKRNVYDTVPAVLNMNWQILVERLKKLSM